VARLGLLDLSLEGFRREGESADAGETSERQEQGAEVEARVQAEASKRQEQEAKMEAEHSMTTTRLCE